MGNKRKCARNSPVASETLALLWSHQDSSLVSLDSPGTETEWSGITNVIKAFDFTVSKKKNRSVDPNVISEHSLGVHQGSITSC